MRALIATYPKNLIQKLYENRLSVLGLAFLIVVAWLCLSSIVKIPSVPSGLLSKTVLKIGYEDTHQPSVDPSRPMPSLLGGYYKVAPSKYELITSELEEEFNLDAVFTCSALFLESYKKIAPPGTWEGLDDPDGRQLLVMEAAKTINPPPTGKFQLVIRNKVDNKLNVRVLKFPKFPWWKKDQDPNPIELSDMIEAHSEKTFIVDFGRLMLSGIGRK